MMDPSTFQIWVVNHMEKILEGQSALANALTKVAELTQREFQLMRNYHSPSASCRPTESCSSTANTDTSISFHRLSRCLDEWKAFHNDREQLKAVATALNNHTNNNNDDDEVPHECCSSVSSDVGGEEDSYAETSTSRQSQSLQLDGHCYLEARSLQGLGVNDEEELQMHEEHGHHQVIGHSRLITRMSARDLEEEKLRRKRERDKQRSAAYRIRKRAAKAGIPPPEFARLKINRRSFRADHDAQQKSGVGENETRCVSSTGDTAEHMGTSSQAVNSEGTNEQESKPLLGIRMSFNQDQTQPKNCFTNL